MMKKFNEFINEDLRSKGITLGVIGNNLTQLYPDIQLRYADDLKIVISCNSLLQLTEEFYETLKKDDINKDDIIFEDCTRIYLYDINGFTKVSDYGEFRKNIEEFDCCRCDNLTNLEGAPEMVGSFDCSSCKSLTSLQGAPKEVGDFICQECNNLSTLQGSPKEVGETFDCSYCENLTSLDGAPEIIHKKFICKTCEKLTNLNGAPKEIRGRFYCRYCNPDFIKLAKEKYGNKVKS